jgi:hypothetical protein
MFNLVAAVFSIILVLVIGGAALYYGGEAYSTQTQETDYAEIVNGATQIKGAMELYKTRNGVYPGGVEDIPSGISATEELLTRLVAEDYLSGVPSGTWTIENTIIHRALEDAQQCESVNRIAGLNVDLVPDGCPPCSDSQFAVWPACQEA